MNAKKAKAIRKLAEFDIHQFEQKEGREVTREERKKFYKHLKRKIKKEKV